MTTVHCSHDAPPARLDTDLDVDPSAWTVADVYTLIGSLVVPRPVAWVSTMSAAGTPNLAPYSYFNLVADDPPHVMFSSIGVKDTLTNIRETGEFVVNLAGRGDLWALDRTSASLGAAASEFEIAGVHAVPAATVRPFRVSQAKAHLECGLAWEAPVGNGTVVVGRVQHIHVDPSVWADGQVVPQLYDPVVRLSHRYGALSPETTAEEAPSEHVFAGRVRR